MKIIFTLRYFLLFFILWIASNVANGQLLIPTLGTAVTQNFDGMGNSASAALPTGFKISAGSSPSWATGTSNTTLSAGTTGSGIITSTSSGGTYNFANGVNFTSTDRALGFLNSSGFTSQQSIILAFTNTTGVTIQSLSINFDYEKYRSGSREFDWTFFHGATVNPTIAATAGNNAFLADAANTIIYNPPAATSKTVTLTGLTIPDNSVYYLKWTLTGVGGSSNGQGLGIDNFSITPYATSAFITAVPDTLSGLDYSGTGPSAPQTFVPSETGTTNPLTLTAPANFEIATVSTGPYSSSLTGIAAGTTIYVRLISGLTPNPYSGRIVISATGALSKNVGVSGTVTSPYCTPSITNTCDEYIKNVTIGTINNTTACGATSAGYSNYSSISTPVSIGQNYTLNINAGKMSDANSGYSTDDIRVWADWNQDGQFTDATENLVLVNNNGGAGSYNFTVPATAIPGNVILRIRLVRDNETSSCGAATYGEAEDYTLVVSSACTSVATVSGFYPATGPAGTFVKIVGGGFTGATAVSFNGVSATSFTIVSATEIDAIVPAGAGTGKITIKDNTGCTYTTTGNFTSITQTGSCPAGAGSNTDLIITEISDPQSGNTHYIEVYNGTSSIITLNGKYSLQVFNDPSTTTTINLTGTIGINTVKVYYAGTNGGQANGTPLGLGVGFNDNDEIRLLKNGSVLDRVLTPNYVGYNYKRLNTVTSPNATYTAAEWTITPESTQNTSDIGTYTTNPGFSITGNPSDVVSCSISMTVTAAPTTGLTYQWKYQNGNTASAWANLSDGTTALPGTVVSGSSTTTLSITGDLTAYNGYQFYAEVVNGTCTKASNAARYTLGASRYFKSNSPVTGNWTASSSWLMSATPSGPWVTTCTYPSATNSDSVSIEPGDTITLDLTNLTLDQVLVKAGGYMKIPASVTLTVGNGGPGSDFNVLGTLEDGANSINSVNFNTGATWSLGPAGSIIKTNSSGSNIWQSAFQGGIATIPATANWILRYTGASTNISLSSTGAYYPNLIFESTTGGNWNPATLVKFTGSSGYVTVKGKLDIGGTGSGTVKTLINENTNAQPLLIMDSLIVRAGSGLTNAGAANGTGFEVRGNVLINGTLTVNSGSTGLLKLSGTTLQTISGAGTIDLQNVTVTNAAGVNIPRDLAVGGNLVLTQGVVNPFGNTLSVGGALTNSSGVIDGDSATLNMTGSAAQTIPANTIQANNLLNLTISNTDPAGVSLGGPIYLYGKLSFGTGSDKLLSSNGYLTLRSTVAGTAMVTDVTNGNAANVNNTINGNVIVERYFPARRSWHLLTAPVSNTGSLYKEWQNGGNYIANSGTYITKPRGTGTAADGLEESYKYSMDTFNTATGMLDNVKNSKLTLLSENTVGGTVPANRGYFTFVRGDRVNINLIPPNSSFTTLRDTGLLQTYTKVFTASLPDTSINKFILIGNPYASPVNFSKLTMGNVLKRFIVWDPRLNTLGAYVLVDGQAGSYVITPSPDPMIGTTGQDSVIQSSQAFFVQANAPGNTSVTFNESSKGTEDNNTVFRPAAPGDEVTGVSQSLRANLYLDDGDTTILADGVYQQFSNSYSIAIDNQDGAKFSNILENLGIAKDNKTLMLERRPSVKETDTIFYKLWNTTARNYQFRFRGSNLNHDGLQGYLVDAYMNTKTKVELNGYTTIAFSVNADAASQATNRFMLVFRPEAALPVTFTSVKAYLQNKNISVEWNVANEINIKSYEVERSVDGTNFIKTAALAAKGNGNLIITYQWPDANVSAGTYYYRIKSIGSDGTIKFSNVVKVIIGNGTPRIYVYPNPIVAGSDITIHFDNQQKGKYAIKLMNKLSQLIMIKRVEHEDGNSVETIPFSKAMAHGTYQLEITKPDNSKANINVLY